MRFKKNKSNLPSILKIFDNIILSDNLFKELNLDFDKYIIFTTPLIIKKYGGKIKLNSLKIYSIENNNLSYLNNLLKKIKKEHKAKILLIAFGGGKIIDSTQYVASQLKVPYLSFPTSLSHDGICSPVAVLKTDRNKLIRLGAQLPLGIIIDLSIIKLSPVKNIKAGIGDLISNLSALQDWILAKQKGEEKVNDFAYMISRIALDNILLTNIKNIKSSGFLKKLAESLILSGLAMEINGNSRPASGAEHLFSHALDYLYPQKSNLHGLQVAFGTLITELLRNHNITELIKLYNKAGLPTKDKMLGYNKEEIINALKLASSLNPKKYTILNEIKLKNNINKILSILWS